MGYSLSWLAVKGKSPQAVRDALGFRATGEREAIPEADLSAAELPGGWHLIVSNRSEQVVSDEVMQQLATGGCELVTCFVEEHVMVSSATGWKDGRRIWSITHDAQEELRHLEIQGEPPPQLAGIRERLFARQTPDTCDYIFDIPVELAATLTGYRHDRVIPELSNVTFEVLLPPPRKSIWNRWLGK